MKIIDYERKDLQLKGSIQVDRENFTALTATGSKKYRSMKGAVKFMEKNGYKPIK